MGDPLHCNDAPSLLPLFPSYSKVPNLEMAFNTLRKMQESGIRPNQVRVVQSHMQNGDSLWVGDVYIVD